MKDLPSVVQAATEYSVIGPDLLVSHASSPRPGDAALFSEHNVHSSSTPSTELSMTQGFPVAFMTASGAIGNYPTAEDPMFPNTSLGVDCHTACSSSLPDQMRIGLQAARGYRAERLARSGGQGKWPETTGMKTNFAYNLATVAGARAAKMPNEVGRLKEGYKADILVYDMLTPNMLAGATHDPVAAIVLHSAPEDIDTVLVDGIVRKRNGKLLPTTVGPSPLGEDEKAQLKGGNDKIFANRGVATPATGDVLAWKDVAKKILESRERIEKDYQQIDTVPAKEVTLAMWGVTTETRCDQ